MVSSFYALWKAENLPSVRIQGVSRRDLVANTVATRLAQCVKHADNEAIAKARLYGCRRKRAPPRRRWGSTRWVKRGLAWKTKAVHAIAYAARSTLGGAGS